MKRFYDLTYNGVGWVREEKKIIKRIEKLLPELKQGEQVVITTWDAPEYVGGTPLYWWGG